jgi:hypothetical protein
MHIRLHRRPIAVSVAAIAVLGLISFGCSNRLTTAPASVGPAGTVEPAKTTTAADCAPAVPFDAGNFSHSTRIDNRWYPLAPGTRYVLEGRADRGGGVLPHRVEFIVTDLVKNVNGADAIVLWDRDFSDGELVEAELAFHAQDNQGNVWNLGEYPEEYEGGLFTGAPNVWISGRAGAEAGIVVTANPRTGDKFLQGYVPDINFLDCAKVAKVGESVCVPVDCYTNVLVIAERSPLEPGSGTQLKYYAPGVGNVQVGAVGDKEKETLVLIERTQLDAAGLRQAHSEALRLEKHAYQVSSAYQQTSPMR